VARRSKSLALPNLAAYRVYIEAHPGESMLLDGLCRISISRFFRDRMVWEYLASDVLTSLAERATSQEEAEIRVWCIGCAGGEECYTMTILWRFLIEPRFPHIALRVLGTDADPDQLARARVSCYPAASLKEMPLAWRQEAFEERAGRFCLRQEFQAGVELQEQDIRRQPQAGAFHLVLCRNLVFTYFEENLQSHIARAIHDRLVPGGVLVLGKQEKLPRAASGFVERAPHLRIYSKRVVPRDVRGTAL
jgi:chemotaxis protein methyltransferase CheR